MFCITKQTPFVVRGKALCCICIHTYNNLSSAIVGMGQAKPNIHAAKHTYSVKHLEMVPYWCSTTQLYSTVSDKKHCCCAISCEALACPTGQVGPPSAASARRVVGSQMQYQKACCSLTVRGLAYATWQTMGISPSHHSTTLSSSHCMGHADKAMLRVSTCLPKPDAHHRFDKRPSRSPLPLPGACLHETLLGIHQHCKQQATAVGQTCGFLCV